jgi:S1-C subfamily serine protease
MTTEHGPQRQDGEQTPNTEHTDGAEQTPHPPYGGQPSYGGQAPYGGQPPDGGQAPYGGQPPDGGQPQYGGQPQSGGQPSYGGQPWYGAVPPPPPPPAMWPAPGMPGGYGGPAHAASGPTKRRSRRTLMAAAGVAAVAIAAGGTAWATSGSSSTTLTTAQVTSQTDPGLVDVISTLGYQHGTAEGTGMVLTPTGEILTNNHVVAGSTSIKVRDIGNGRTYTARVVGYSDSNDVAVLQLNGASGLSTVTIGNSDTATAGQKVVALGNADGKDGTPSVATGQISTVSASVDAQDEGSGTVEHLTNMIQTNANIQPGDSGGPLLNEQGQVIGMDTAASTGNSGGFGTTASMTTTAFSIPINRAISIADQIEAGQASTTVHIGATGFLGVEVAPPSAGGLGQTSSGVPIEGVVSGTAAATAGLGGGDTILSVGGQQVASSSALQTMMESHHPGDKVSITWSDAFGQTHTATVTLTAGPTG